jgi:hypothetical protein
VGELKTTRLDGYSERDWTHQTMAQDIFISYSARDKAVADAACATLEAKDVGCRIALET